MHTTTPPQKIVLALLVVVGALTVLRELLQTLDRISLRDEIDEHPERLHDEIREHLEGEERAE